MRWLLTLLPFCLFAQSGDDVRKWLERPLLDAKQPLDEVQVYTASRVPVVPAFSSALEWDRYAGGIRRQMLDKVVFRGEARQWRRAERRVEWLDTLPGQGYRVKKFRFEVVPGLWVPGLLYEPEQMTGKVPVVMNVNGHEKEGISTPYIQMRCINLARRGMLAVNVEWLGRGQLSWDDFNHFRMNQIDLTGTSGLAVFYLEMERTLDIVLGHEHADLSRVAVTGLSGGGWQTTFISALDTRVKLSVPVAGHSSFVTRAQWPQLDMGDSEQTPTDMATVADYLHLSDMVAPRPLMFINNAKDNCCFRADYAVGPLLQSARNIYALYGAPDRLRYFINFSEGHNYDQSSREELYRFLRDQFFPGNPDYPLKEIPVDSEVRTAARLASPLPENNATFHALATKLARDLPRGEGTRDDLARVVRIQQLSMDAREVGRETSGGMEVAWWRFRLGGSWTVPGVETGPAGARDIVILLGDNGRASLADRAAALANGGKRVLAVDPFYVGESRITQRDALFAMQIAALGERPLGLQASQITAIARWLKGRGMRATLESHGRRTSLMSVVAAALEPSIQGATLHDSLRSLKQILQEDLTAEKWPEFFCFGLLEKFDIPQIAALGNHVGLREAN
ncbi:MAG: alpha/beta hydrolase family protein [Bryobacterales bacterium]|nr:alpha/beta hydrolase family protein [Bryobacterales bacterium]